MYASSLSKEGSRKDGTVLELRPGRIHAGGHSSYVPLRTVRFPSLDGETDDATVSRQLPSPPAQQPQRPAQAQATNGSSQPATADPLRPLQAYQPSPTQPIVLRTDSDSARSPLTAPADAALAVETSETTLSHWAALPTVRQLDAELASGLTLSAVPEGQSPPHAAPGRLVHAGVADGCSASDPRSPGDPATHPGDFSFGLPDRADSGGSGAGVSVPGPYDAALSVAAPTAANLRHLPGPPSSTGGGPPSETCSRSSSPGRAPRIWRASAGWWPDGGQPPPPPPKVCR